MSDNPAPPQQTQGNVSPYAVREIDLEFQIGQGSFGETGERTLISKGLRVVVQIEFAVFPMSPLANIRVYGLTLNQINEISKAGRVYQSRDNKIIVTAGDKKLGKAKIFQGQIVEAYPDFTESPNVALFIFATSTYSTQMKPTEPLSFSGPTKAADVLQEITQKAGIPFENNGVNVVLSSPYLPGSAWQQIGSVVKASNVFAGVDPSTGTLAVWPKDGSRNGSEIEISPQTGMIGYPSFQGLNITLRTLFDPRLSKINNGSIIKVESQLTAADGKFIVLKVGLNLASQMENGPWEMSIEASPFL